MTVLYASVKSASCFAVAAFTPSTTVPRFGRTSKVILVTRRLGHEIDFTPDEITTFRSKIEKLELPDPPFRYLQAAVSTAPAFRPSNAGATSAA